MSDEQRTDEGQGKEGLDFVVDPLSDDELEDVSGGVRAPSAGCSDGSGCADGSAV